MIDPREVIVIDKLDLENNILSKEKIKQLINNEVEYLIIDRTSDILG